ncbi:YkvA family protein [Cesiribacter andamanensis]|uniref:DUF1232 domain-containing protein n=1 Tax=Cesiribacter andamanensis AMV16 TaxID=1279009 RepID=M7N543_9BACT|nr:YkvA family protein [Cesiribacter andamanensis]EMR02331.1 hypothetical protein ADICEAN_02529 [Cesiribacter andamanensis AMV16]
MSREKHLKRLKASLSETQNILGDLIAGTGKDASKRFTKANKRLQHTYDDASSELEALLKESTSDVQKQFSSTRKDLEKQYASTRKDLDKQAAKAKSQLSNRFADGKALARSAKAGLGASAIALASKTHLPSRAANAAAFLAKTGLAAKAVELATKADLRTRTANLLEGAAGGFIAARNKLNPNSKVIVLNEKDRHNVSKAGYFARFAVLAIVIISKREKLMKLGKDLYNKIQEKGVKEALTQEASEQFNTMRRLIKAYSNGQYREFPYRSLVKIVAAVIYFVSVVDLIPDFIPVLGLTDDLAILAWVYASVKDDLQQFVEWEAAEDKRKTRLAKQSSGSSSGSDSASGSGIANVGNASASDRKASPNVTTSSGETGKATVTTGTTGSSSSASSSSAGDTSTAGRTPSSGGSSSNPGNRTGGNSPS